MGAQQSQIEASPYSLSRKDTASDMRDVDLISKAERKYEKILRSMKDAYGDEDGYTLFKLVVLSPQKYQCDNRRLIQTLARESIVSLEGFGSSASQSSKMGVLKSGLVFIYESLQGSGWKDQRPGWNSQERQSNAASW